MFKGTVSLQTEKEQGKKQFFSLQATQVVQVPAAEGVKEVPNLALKVSQQTPSPDSIGLAISYSSQKNCLCEACRFCVMTHPERAH